MDYNKTIYAQTHYRNVRELSEMELNILRCQVAVEKYDDTQLDPDYISDEEVFEYYEDTNFVWEDFHSHYCEDEDFEDFRDELRKHITITEQTKYAQDNPRNVRELTKAELDQLRPTVANKKRGSYQGPYDDISDEDVFEHFKDREFEWEDFHNCYDEDENFNHIQG